MGIIYKNSVQYSGMIAEKGGSDDRELTQAEYDALSEEEKMNGTTYYITDADAGSTQVKLPYFYGEQSSQIQGTWSNATLIGGLRFTVTEPGVYFISAVGNIGEANGSTVYPRIGIYINETRGQYSAIRLVASDQKTWSTQQVSRLNVGDVVDVRIWGAGTKVSLFEGQRLTAFRIA